MAYIALILSLLITGVVCSLVDVDTLSSSSSQPDYHLVPFAGDVFKA